MPWQNQGGPWGGGGSGGGGGGGGGQGPWGRGPSGGGPRQPDIEDMVRRTQDRLKNILPGGGGWRGLALILVVFVLIWLATGFYRVDAGEQGIEMVFGRWNGETTQPGLNWNYPAPIGSVETPNVEQRTQTQIGLTYVGESTTRAVEEESLMLTGDENIIDIQFVVIWKISNAGEFVFNVRDQEATVKSAAEAAMREIVGQSNFERMLTADRAEVGRRARILIQQILDTYGAGILVETVAVNRVDAPQQVVDAFRDVQAAKADQQRLINEAQLYFNQITQRAEGESQQIILAAEGYKAQTIALATGHAQRFISVYDQYKANPGVTSRRLYLETMERILSNMNKVLVDNSAGNGTIPYLPLDQLINGQQPATAPVPAPSEIGTTP
jgi:membrane protease subunit HflK